MMHKKSVSFVIFLVVFFFFFFGMNQTDALEITRVEPSADSTVDELKPTIYLYFKPGKDEVIKEENVKMTLNGIDVTWKCLIVNNCITCQPTYRFPEGKNSIKFIYNGAGPVEHEWSFTIQSRDNKSGELSHNGAPEPFQEGDIIEVELKSLSGGTARFNLGDWKQELIMKEVSPGIYKGNYKVERFDNAKEQEVTATLSTREGKLLEFTSPVHITVSAYFFKVKILSPKNDSVVDNYFDITGRTRPGSLVSIAPQLTFTGGIGTSTNPGTLGAIEVMADEKGFFKVHYGFPIKIASMQISFYVTARDSEGNMSFPVTFSVKVK